MNTPIIPNLFTGNFGKFDPIGSTYRHEIFLKNGATLVGYSKGRNLREMADKDTLIQKVIVRLFRNGYLHPGSKGSSKETICIAFYVNDPIDLQLVAILYPGKYDLAPGYVGNTVLINFLDRFYTVAKTGQERRNLVKEPRKKDFFSLDIEFASTADLIKYVHDLENKYGYSHSEAVKFYSAWMKTKGHTLES